MGTIHELRKQVRDGKMTPEQAEAYYNKWVASQHARGREVAQRAPSMSASAAPSGGALGWDARTPVQQHWAERGMEASTPGTPLNVREQSMIAANADQNLIRDTRKQAALASERGQRIRKRTPLIQREIATPENAYKAGGIQLPVSRTPTHQDLIKNMTG